MISVKDAEGGRWPWRAATSQSRQYWARWTSVVTQYKATSYATRLPSYFVQENVKTRMWSSVLSCTPPPQPQSWAGLLEGLCLGFWCRSPAWWCCYFLFKRWQQGGEFLQAEWQEKIVAFKFTRNKRCRQQFRARIFGNISTAVNQWCPAGVFRGDPPNAHCAISPFPPTLASTKCAVFWE